jgi:raffinose/stachyose/melibiose transport system substrate-binding protein
MKKKQIMSLLLTGAMAATMFAGCGSTKESAKSKGPSVYYLNFKPEQDKDWQKLAKEYTKETGVPVTVILLAVFVVTDSVTKLSPPTVISPPVFSAM